MRTNKPTAELNLANCDIDTLREYLIQEGMMTVLKRIPIKDYDMKQEVDLFQNIGTISIGGKNAQDFVINESNLPIIQNLIKWVMGDNTVSAIDPNNPMSDEPNGPASASKGIYIAGPTGTGKTTLIDVLIAYIRLKKICVWRSSERDGVIKVPLIIKKISASQITNQYVTSGYLEPIFDLPFLYIDDLGSEVLSSKYMGTEKNVLKELIEYRGDHRELITIFTSNYTYSAKTFASSLYGDRAQSRLFEMCNLYHLIGQDFRKSKNQAKKNAYSVSRNNVLPNRNK